MYLPRRLYELLPYAYVLAGLLLCAVSYMAGASALSNVAFIVGGLALIAGCVLILRRRAYRDDAARYDPHSLDD
jgi:hypothetical protein